jgi:hypothetical protein
MKEIQDKIIELLSSLSHEEQNQVINNIRDDNREKRMKEIYLYETKINEIKRSMDKI